MGPTRQLNPRSTIVCVMFYFELTEPFNTYVFFLLRIARYLTKTYFRTNHSDHKNEMAFV